LKWKVQNDENVDQEIKVAFKQGSLTLDDIKVLKAWTSQIEEQSLEFMQKNPLWNDHALDREWEGHRSSSFSRLGRIIYRVENDIVVIQVVRITTTHDYKKEK
jgi:mRNA-degrading endonuclease YafQ of YafQ-DinJ toxin-antitoxin module